MRLYVPLNRDEYEALERLACAERRRPQDQAAILIVRTLAGTPSGTRSREEQSTEDLRSAHDSESSPNAPA
jgi:hypothetical protein